MAFETPPWLNVGPRDFGNAASEGARLDLARQQADTEAAMNAVRLGIQKQQSDRDFALQSEQHALDSEVKRQQLTLQTQAAARKVQAQQQYNQLVASGVEPAQAMLKVGPNLGESLVGAGQLARWGQPPPPPKSIDFGNGQGGVYYNHRYFPNKPAAKEFTDEEINGHTFQRDSTGKLYPVLHAADAEGVLTPQQKARITFLQAKRKSLEMTDLDGTKTKPIDDELDRLTGAGGGSEEAPAAAAQPAPSGQPSFSNPITMVWNAKTKRYMMPSQ